MRAVSLALVSVLLVSTPVFAYGPRVDEARAWLRDRTTPSEFACAHVLWTNESHWATHAGELYGSYGIPQAYPGSKMARAERPRWGRRWDDYRHDALVQVSWGRRYVNGVYGSFCAALRFQDINGWY